MGCHRIRNGIVCLPNIYRYKGFTFEMHKWMGPCKLKKDFEPAARMGMKFYKVVTEWAQMGKRAQRRTQVYG